MMNFLKGYNHVASYFNHINANYTEKYADLEALNQ